jgi:hypothetical protein
VEPAGRRTTATGANAVVVNPRINSTIQGSGEELTEGDEAEEVRGLKEENGAEGEDIAMARMGVLASDY